MASLPPPFNVLITSKTVSVFVLGPYSVGIDFSRQNLKSVDVRFWSLKSIPELWE